MILETGLCVRWMLVTCMLNILTAACERRNLAQDQKKTHTGKRSKEHFPKTKPCDCKRSTTLEPLIRISNSSSCFRVNYTNTHRYHSEFASLLYHIVYVVCVYVYGTAMWVLARIQSSRFFVDAICCLLFIQLDQIYKEMYARQKAQPNTFSWYIFRCKIYTLSSSSLTWFTSR